MAITQADIQATLESVTPKVGTENLNIDTVNQGFDFNMTPEQQAAYDQYSQANQPATGMLPLQQYYPGVNQSVLVGQTSDQFGSRALIAPGAGLVPLGMLDAREKALQQAALRKQQDVDQFMKSFKAPTSKLVNINDMLREEYFGHLEKGWQGALKAAGGDASKAAFMLKNNMNFQQQEKSFQDLARFGDDIVAKTAQDEEEIKSGRFVPTPSYKELKTKLYTALDPSNPEFKNLGNTYRKMQLERDFSDSFNEVTKKMVADQKGYAYDTVKNDPEFIKEYEGTIKEWSQEQKDAVANTLSENIYAGSDYFTPQKIKRDVYGLMSGKQEDRKIAVKEKRESEISKLNIGAVTDESNLVNAKTVVVGKKPTLKDGKVVGTEDVESLKDVTHEIYDQSTFEKPVKVVIPISALGSDLETGKLSEGQKNVSAEIGGIGNTLVYKSIGEKDKSINDKMIDKEAADVVKRHSVYEPRVELKYKFKNKEGEEEEKSQWVPLHAVKNAIRGSRGENDKALQEIEDRAAKRTERHKASFQNTAKPSAQSAEKTGTSGIKWK